MLGHQSVYRQLQTTEPVFCAAKRLIYSTLSQVIGVPFIHPVVMQYRQYPCTQSLPVLVACAYLWHYSIGSGQALIHALRAMLCWVEFISCHTACKADNTLLEITQYSCSCITHLPSLISAPMLHSHIAWQFHISCATYEIIHGAKIAS